MCDPWSISLKGDKELVRFEYGGVPEPSRTRGEDLSRREPISVRSRKKREFRVEFTVEESFGRHK